MSNKFQFDRKWMVDENWNNQSVSKLCTTQANWWHNSRGLTPQLASSHYPLVGQDYPQASLSKSPKNV